MAMNQQMMMKQARKMQAKMNKIQEEVASETVEASVGGGMVTAVVSGNNVLVELHIDKDAIDPEDTEMLEDMIIAAVNQGLEDAQNMASEKMSAVTAGLNIPGLF